MLNSRIHAPSRYFPRLMIERSDISRQMVGFLQVGSASKRIELGDPEGREFRLMQCLFSPKNFMSARYEPVMQTHERVFGAIRLGADASNARLTNGESVDNEMTAIVERSLQVLRKGEVGEYFSFISHAGKVRMAKV